MAAPSIAVRLGSAPEQEILVRVRGADVRRFEGNLPADADPDVLVFDPVETFARAAALGMLGPLFRASILDQRVDLGKATQRWHLRVAGVDPGALRVLAHLLLARDLDAIEIVAVEGAPPGEPLEIERAAYPRAPEPLPFALTIEPAERPSRDRFLQIVFAAAPGDGLVREVYAALEIWTRLLLLGGYPPPGRSARASGALPDIAFQLDAHTVEQAFPDLFLCDEACFVAVFGYALRLHEGGTFIEHVRVG